MKLFTGFQRTDYQDILRAIGYFIDSHGYVDIRIIESDEGIVFQGRSSNGRNLGEYNYDTFLITEDQLKEMAREAYQRRRRKLPGTGERTSVPRPESSQFR